MATNQECARVSRELRALFGKVCSTKAASQAKCQVFMKCDPVFRTIESILIYRSTLQNTTPVVVVLEERDDKIFLHARYFVEQGTFNKNGQSVEATTKYIAQFEPLFARALTFS